MSPREAGYPPCKAPSEAELAEAKAYAARQAEGARPRSPWNRAQYPGGYHEQLNAEARAAAHDALCRSAVALGDEASRLRARAEAAEACLQEACAILLEEAKLFEHPKMAIVSALAVLQQKEGA